MIPVGDLIFLGENFHTLNLPINLVKIYERRIWKISALSKMMHFSNPPYIIQNQFEMVNLDWAPAKEEFIIFWQFRLKL